MRGRKPKPTAIKVAEGNPGKRRLNRGELLEVPIAPAPPSYLSAAARREWEKLIPVLLRRRTIAEEDQTMLASFCEAVATLNEARRMMAGMEDKKRLLVTTGRRVTEKVDAKGKVVSRDTAGGNVQVNPLLYVIRDQVATIARIASEFGLTPAARARLQLEALPPGGAAVDPLEAILGSAAEHDPSDPVVLQ